MTYPNDLAKLLQLAKVPIFDFDLDGKLLRGPAHTVGVGVGGFGVDLLMVFEQGTREAQVP